jgi:hypothetical protein
LLGRGYLLVNFNYCISVILIPLLSTDLTLLLWFPNLKEATKWKGNETKRNETKSTKTKRNETKWKRNKTKPTKSTKTKRNTMLDYFPHMSQCLSPGEDRIWSPLNKNTMHLFSGSLSFSLSRFVFVDFVGFVLFRFHFVSFRFVFVDFVSFRFVSFRFRWFRFVSFRFVSFRFVSISFRTL